MNESLIQRIKDCPTLPSLPSIAIQVLDLAQKEEADIAEIARVISKDPALSSKILRTVNSSFYGRSQSISTISHALVILGLQSVKTLVLGFSLVSTLSKTRAKGFKHLTYWRRSIFGATAARMIAGKVGLVQQEECFLSALMMDIGMLVLDQVVGEPYGALNDKAESHDDLIQIERDAQDMTHADVAGLLAAQWKLPPLLAEPMAHHHDPGVIIDLSLRRVAEVVRLASACADVFVDENAARAIATVRKFSAERFGLSDADCDKLLEDIGTRTREVAPLFEINIGPATNYEAILKKANEALVEQTLRMQQQTTTLVEQNQQLKVQATTDGLTGLANRASLEAFLAEKFASASADGKGLAVLMMDVDKFKSINDTHGHPVGDQVLKFIGKLVRTAARAQDLAARYGGEEMVLVLPGTARNTAAAIAETIRRALAARPVTAGAKTLNVTASIGVAACEPAGLFREAGQLMKAADMAVYAAKHAGRNCVRVFSAPKAKVA